MLRPRPARWFEVLAARDDATLVLEALARTGAVELEARGGVPLAELLRGVLPLQAQFLDLQTRYRAYWPAPQACQPSSFPEPPLQCMQRCLASLRAWAVEAEPLIRAMQQAQADDAELRLWQPVLQAMKAMHVPPSASASASSSTATTAPSPPESTLAGAGPWLGVRLVVLAAQVDAATLMPAAPALVATPLAAGGETTLLLVAGTPAALQTLAEAVTAHKGSLHAVPAWWRAELGANEAEMARRLHDAQQQLTTTQAALAELAPRHALATALGDAERLHWLLHNVQTLESGELLCWLTGWCSDPQSERLALALRQSGARALLRDAAPPSEMQAPLLLDNPPWARPFELFSRAMGMPAATEADPSPLLALAVPLMFGYMFGDLGQGLVLAAVGAWARKRWPLARLLMVGGVSAAIFGLMFGSLFGLHGVIPAWWLHPLDQPLPVLLTPVFGGVVLLSLGLVLDALSARWRSEGTHWWRTDAALLLVYLSLAAAALWPQALGLALGVSALGLVWFCAGHALGQRRPGAVLAAAFKALGEAVEKMVQILINTVSFARVGAFALAHAGLSSAVNALMDAAESLTAKALVLVLGNVVVIVLEVMVVSIQTTRLVLFEFFTRFMQAQGRAFRPLPPPPFKLQET